MEVDTIVANLRAVLLSTKGGVPISKVMRDYKSMVGEPIQFRRLGFDSLESFIKSVPGFQLINVGGEVLLNAIPTKRTEHVAALVANQRNGSKKSKGKPPFASKPRTFYHQSIPKKPPLKFQRPPIAPRFAASSKMQTSNSLPGDNNTRYALENEELKNRALSEPAEEEPPKIVNVKNNDIDDNSLNNQMLHLNINKQNETAVHNVSTDLSKSPDPSEGDENSVFMCRLAQLTSQIHSRHPGNDSELHAASIRSEDDSLDILNSRLAYFTPSTTNTNIVSSPDSGFQGTSNILSSRLTHFTRHMHNETSNSDCIFNGDFKSSNSRYDDDGDENNIFNRRLAHFSSKLCNKASPYDFILENGVTERNCISKPQFGHFLSNNQDVMKQSHLTPGVPNYFSSALVPPQSYENTISNSGWGLFPNGTHGKVLPPDSKDVNSHNFFKSGIESAGILNVQIPCSGTQMPTPRNNGDLSYMQTPSPSGSYASALSESDRVSIHAFSQNPRSSSSEAAVSLVSSGSVSPKSDTSGVLSMPVSIAGVRNSRGSLKASEVLDNPDQKLLSSCQSNGSVFSDICVDDLLRVTPELLSKSSVSVPDLLLPEEDIWNVFVICALNTQEIYANIIGKDYSDAFDAMAQSMELYYADCAVATESFEIGCSYAVQINSLWHRVKLENIEGENCCVFLLDIGILQMCPMSELRDLHQRFTFLPAQAICLSLFGLEDHVRDDSINEMLVEYESKTFVAEVVHRDAHTAGISVYLFDVSSGRDVVVNEELKKLIA